MVKGGNMKEKEMMMVTMMMTMMIWILTMILMMKMMMIKLDIICLFFWSKAMKTFI